MGGENGSFGKFRFINGILAQGSNMLWFLKVSFLDSSCLFLMYHGCSGWIFLNHLGDFRSLSCADALAGPQVAEALHMKLGVSVTALDWVWLCLDGLLGRALGTRMV